MDPISASLAAGGIELAKFFLIAYFTSMQMANKTPEEMEVFYVEQKTLFLKKDPSKIPT